MMQTLILNGPVPSKKNSRNVFVRAGKPVFAKRKINVDFEQLVAGELIAQRTKRIEGPIEFSMLLVWGGHEPDLDNAITTVLDALQDGGLFDNDRAVAKISDCEKRRSSGPQDPPRAIITIGNYEA